MFRRSSSQGSLWESAFQLSDRKRGRLEKTWGKTFRERCLPLIDEERFRALYCEDNGTPCKSVRLVVAVTILRHLFDLTHEETQYHVDFDLRWHLALGLDPCDDADYVAERTLRYFEVKLVEHALVGALFTELTDQLIARLGVKTGQQRLDTSHLLSNIARLSRLGLFCETHRVLLKALQREAPARLERLPLSLRRRYLRADGTDSSYDDARAADSRRRLGVAARDAYRLREALRGVALPDDSAAAYAVLTRLVTEHCEEVAAPQPAADGDGDADLAPVPVIVKDAKQLTGDVLQTPHDPEVTYSGHKGQGYEALLAETSDPDNAVQLITHVSLERSCESDADRVLPTVAALRARDIAPETLLADTAFGSQANYEACAVQGVDLVAPLPGGGAAEPDAPTPGEPDGFVVQCFPSDPPTVCPAGIAAEATVLRQTSAGPVALVQLPAGACDGCARRASCPLFTGPDGRPVALVELRGLLRADRQAFVQTAAFQDAYRPRAGIEGTNSELKRGQGLDKVRVRGQARVEYALVMRVLACNVKRALKYWGNQAKSAALSAELVGKALLETRTPASKVIRDLIGLSWFSEGNPARPVFAAA